MASKILGVAVTVVVAALAGSALPVAATSLTFDSAAHNDPERLTGPYNGNYTYQAFTEQGFVISIIPSPWFVWGRNDLRNADQGGATLTNLDGRARTAIEAVGNGQFTLNSFQIASFYNGSQTESGFPTSFTVRFNGDITTDQQFAVDSRPGFQNFNFNRSGIHAFEIRNAYLQLDNVVLNAAGAAMRRRTTAFMKKGA